MKMTIIMYQINNSRLQTALINTNGTFCPQWLFTSGLGAMEAI